MNGDSALEEFIRERYESEILEGMSPGEDIDRLVTAISLLSRERVERMSGATEVDEEDVEWSLSKLCFLPLTPPKSETEQAHIRSVRETLFSGVGMPEEFPLRLPIQAIEDDRSTLLDFEVRYPIHTDSWVTLNRVIDRRGLANLTSHIIEHQEEILHRRGGDLDEGLEGGSSIDTGGGQGAAARQFALRTETGRAAVVSSSTPREAALRAARDLTEVGSSEEDAPHTEIRLREEGSDIVHVYEAWAWETGAPDDSPDWMPRRITEANVSKVGTERVDEDEE